MNKLIKKALKLILPLVLGGFILFWVYRDFDFAKAGYVLLHGVNWWWMLFSLAFGVFSHIIRGWRWKMTLEPLGAFPKTGDCVNAIFCCLVSEKSPVVEYWPNTMIFLLQNLWVR